MLSTKTLRARKAAALLFVTALTVSLVPATMASANTEELSSLSGATVPAISVSEAELRSAVVTANGEEKHANDVVLQVDSSQTSQSLISIAGASRVEGTATAVSLKPTRVPQDGEVSVAVDVGGQIAQLSEQSALDGLGAGTYNTAWSFTAAGRYEIELIVETTVPSVADGTESAESVSLVDAQTYRFSVAPSAATQPEGDASEEAAPLDSAPTVQEGAAEDEETGDTATAQTTTPSPVAASDITVLDEGHVRYAPRLTDGNLEAGLLDETGGYHPIGTSVLHIPNQDQVWPGTYANGNTRNETRWAAVVPRDVLPWRTTGIQQAAQRVPAPANELVFGHSGELLDGVAGDINYAEATVPSEALFAIYIEGNQSTSATYLWSNGAPGLRDVLPDAARAGLAGLSGTKAGVYCLTVEPTVDGQSIRDTITIVMGALPAGTDYLCAQGDEDNEEPGGPEDPEEPVEPGTGNTVITSGEIRIAPRVVDGALELALREAVTGESGDVWHDPKNTVIHLPNKDLERPNQRFLGTSASTAWEEIYPAAPTLAYRTTGQTVGTGNPGVNPLGVAFDSGDTAGSQGVSFRLRKTSTDSDGGYFTSYQTRNGDTSPMGNSFPVWDSRPTGAAPPIFPRDSDASVRSGWLFSQPGVYCLTFSAEHQTAELLNTFTVVVGDQTNPHTVDTCAPPAALDDDYITYPDNGVHYLHRGHIDIGLLEKQGGLGLGVTVEGEDAPVDFDDVVLVGNTPHNKRTALPGEDYITSAGSEYWHFSLGNNGGHTLWPGFAFVPFGGQGLDGPPTWSVLDVTGPGGAQRPGDMVMYGSYGNVGRGDANDIWFSTKRGLPEAKSSLSDHTHGSWSFSAPGVYCITFEAQWQASSGKRETHRDLLTVAVGDTATIDATTVLPCSTGMDQPYPAQTLDKPTQADPAATTTIDSGTVTLTPFVSEDGTAELYASHRSTADDTPQNYSADRVVFSTQRNVTSELWELGRFEPGISPNLNIDSRHLATEHGDATLHLGQAQGPGIMKIQRLGFGEVYNSGTPESVNLDLRAGWFEQDTRMTFSAPGVYCLPTTVSIPGAGNTSLQRESILTFVVGDSTVSRDIDLCSDRGEATDPGEEPGGGVEPGGENPPAKIEWDVPNGSTTTSGARIINDGHVDIASVLSGSTLDTKIKDDTTGTSTPDFLNPEHTVLQVTPYAKTTVTEQAQGFIANVGDTVWETYETQQNGVLWPGWSTERVPLNATTGGIDWKLTAIDGPGELAVWANGAEQVFFNTKDGITGEDQFEIPKNSHTHANWTFTAEGVYCIAWERSGTLTSGNPVMDSFVTVFAVGEVNVKDIDPSKCFTEPGGKPSDDQSGNAPANLHEGNAGEVQVFGAGDGFTPGQLVTLQVGTVHAGEWVSAWLGSKWMGWAHVEESGAIQTRIPTDATLGSHRLSVTDHDGKLLGWDSLSIVAPKAPEGPGDGDDPGNETPIPDALWNVPNGTVNNKGAAVLNNGHADIASLVENGQLVTKVNDTTASNDAVWRDPAQTVLQLLPSSRASIPAGNQWSFLGKGGAPFYQVTQTAQAGLLWPGWSTEAIPLSATTGGVTWALTDTSGPGEFSLYQTDSFGQPTLLFNTRDGITSADRVTIPKNTHAHGSWAFSEQGNYCLSMQRTAQLPGAKTVSDQFVLAVAVGTADVMEIDPAKCGETVDTTPVDITPPPAGDGTVSTTPAAQSVAAQQCVAGATILSAGHIDFATRIVGGKLESLIGEDTSGTKVYREPSGTILWLKPSSLVTLPSGYGAVGPAGSQVWQVPQTQNLDLIWLGWNTESLNAGNTRGPVSWTINSVDGPGTVKVYQGGAFGGVQSMQFNNGGTYQIPQGVHAHANWAFSAEGIYQITMTQTVMLANGQTSSDTETLTIAVGNVDPASAASVGSGCGTVSNAMLLSDDADATLLSAAQAAADAAIAARDRLPGQGSDVDGGFVNPFTALAEGNPVPLLLSILGVLLLAGAAGGGVLWWRRRSHDIVSAAL